MGIPTVYQFPVLTADGQTAAANVVSWPGGQGVFVAYGTFGSGTVKLQWSPDDGTTWIDAGAAPLTLTAAGYGPFTIPKSQLRVSLTGSTAPSIKSGVAHATPSVAGF